MVGEGPDPAPHVGDAVAVDVDGVDAAVDAPQRLPLVHGDVGLAEGPGDDRAVEQVAGPDPRPPLGDDVEPEPGGVLVELPHRGVDGGGVEVGPGQLVERGHDAGVGGVAHVGAAQHLGQGPHVVGADVAGAGLQRHDEGQVLGLTRSASRVTWASRKTAAEAIR